ncbi:hypothetical protein SAMN03159463_00299 [Mesorhizobium sp. NFR06]|nr:hypothetical protein SAMN03159463_00299 [Mesorhizobium sp. NFR06]
MTSLTRSLLHPLIVTLGIGMIVQGAVLLWTGGFPSGSAPQAVSSFVSIGDSVGPCLCPCWCLASWCSLRWSSARRSDFYSRHSRRALLESRRARSESLAPASKAWVAATQVVSPPPSVQTGQSLPQITLSQPKHRIVCST